MEPYSTKVPISIFIRPQVTGLILLKFGNNHPHFNSAGSREEAKNGDGRQGFIQSVCGGGEKADLAGQPGSFWGRGLATSQAVHRGEGSGSVQQRPLHSPQLF